MTKKRGLLIENETGVWKDCCKEEVARIWLEHHGPMEVCFHIGRCPECGEFIGLTQTSEEDAIKFLKK